MYLCPSLKIFTHPTRGDNCLDLILTSYPSTVKNVDVVDGISDHRAVTADVMIKLKCNKQTPREVYQFHKGDMQGVKDSIHQASESFIENATRNSVEDNWQQFKLIINKAIHDNIPIKKLGTWRNAPWITRNLLRKIRKRKRLYIKSKQKKTQESLKHFKEFRNSLRKELDKAEQNYLNGLFPDDEPTPDKDRKSNITKRLWAYVKSKKNEASGIPPLLDQTGRTISGDQDKVELLNNHYTKVFTKEDTATIPTPSGLPHPIMPDIEVGIGGVEKLLSKLNPKKAQGPDQLPLRVLKEASAQVAPLLTSVFNQSLNTGEVPTDWLQANVVSIHKKDSKSDVNNYRPVSLTAVPSKLLEHIIHHSVMGHSDKHHIIIDNQHGFRTGHSTESQLILTVEDLARSLDNGHTSDVLILDFSKAFDKVPHRRLLQKVHHCGIQGKTHRWITNWLTARYQQTVLNNIKSSPSAVTSGVPQGTVLGPLLFLIYINDITTGISSNIRLFADDCVVYRQADTQEESDILQSDLNTLADWATKWQMDFHPKKCYLLQATRKQSPPQHTYTMFGQQLAQVPQHKYLGVTIQENMSFTSHISETCKKANQSLAFTRRNLHNCSEEVKRRAYTTLTRPHLEYGSAVWDPIYKTQITELQKVQRRAARFIKNDYSHESSVTTMLSQLNLPPLATRRLIHRICIFHHAYYGTIAIPIPSYIISITRPTRHSSETDFIQVSTSANYYQQTFFPRTVCDWNALPASMKMIVKPEPFKSALEAHLHGTK
jgi:hypothetical protein